MEKILGSYINGNYKVILLSDGTKIRYNKESSFIPDTVESMDIKITNKCNMNCRMCHENSTIDGKHGDIMNAQFINYLHPYTELAIGGGNPLEHPDLIPFLQKCKNLKLIPSITVNQKHFIENYDQIKELKESNLIYGIGVSLVNATDELIAKVKVIPDTVIHTIAGLTTEEEYRKLSGHGLRVLILGYKHFRKGDDLYKRIPEHIDHYIEVLKECLPDMLKEKWFKVLSFDNLALKQLDIEELVSPEDWEEFYMGDDGIGNNFDSATMYIDMVENKFAKNSCELTRYDLLSTVDEMFRVLQQQV